jgi:methyl coenzyme M reductase alpha subunit
VCRAATPLPPLVAVEGSSPSHRCCGVVAESSLSWGRRRGGVIAGHRLLPTTRARGETVKYGVVAVSMGHSPSYALCNASPGSVSQQKGGEERVP